VVRVTLILLEYKPKEIEKEKKSVEGSESVETVSTKDHPCAKQGSLADSECRRLYIEWRREREKALKEGKTFPPFEVWVKSQPLSPASDDEA